MFNLLLCFGMVFASSSSLVKAEENAKKSEQLLQQSDKVTDRVLAEFHKKMEAIQKSLNAPAPSFLQKKSYDDIDASLSKIDSDLKKEEQSLRSDQEKQSENLRKSSLIQNSEGHTSVTPVNFEEQLEALHSKFQKELDAVAKDSTGPFTTSSFLQSTQDTSAEEAKKYEEDADKNLNEAEASLRKLNDDLAAQEKQLRSTSSGSGAISGSSFIQTALAADSEIKLNNQIDALENKVKDEINALKNNDLSYFNSQKNAPSFIETDATLSSLNQKMSNLAQIQKDIDATNRKYGLSDNKASLVENFNFDQSMKNLSDLQKQIVTTAQKYNIDLSFLKEIRPASFVQLTDAPLDSQIAQSSADLKKNEDDLVNLQKKFDSQMSKLEQENKSLLSQAKSQSMLQSSSSSGVNEASKKLDTDTANLQSLEDQLKADEASFGKVSSPTIDLKNLDILKNTNKALVA